MSPTELREHRLRLPRRQLQAGAREERRELGQVDQSVAVGVDLQERRLHVDDRRRDVTTPGDVAVGDVTVDDGSTAPFAADAFSKSARHLLYPQFNPPDRRLAIAVRLGAGNVDARRVVVRAGGRSRVLSSSAR